VGYSSNVAMSSDTDTRVVAAYIYGSTATGTLNTSDNIVKYPALTRDTHGAYNSSTGQYTVPVPGWYQVNASYELQHASTAAGNEYYISIYTGTSGSTTRKAVAWEAQAVANVPTRRKMRISSRIYCNAGEVIEIRSSTGGTTPSFANVLGGSEFDVALASGPATIAASESVNLQYSLTSSAPTIGTSPTVLVYNEKVRDSHGSYNSSTGVFTAPRTCVYRITASMRSQSAVSSSSLDHAVYLAVRINGNINKYLSFFTYPVTSVSITPDLKGSVSVKLNAGDTVDIVSARDSGVGSFITSTSGTHSYMMIESVSDL
ncbi:MAG TPA: hypothetical protein PKZ49_09200, partial [Nitrosomonas sp.]|nr:hypothetical protein [Nitrosomonas sp.]